MAYLEIETREGVQRIGLAREQLSIGRLASNDIMLPFSQISRQHAELRRVGGQWWIADLHSTNGLHLNARRIQQHALQDGDKIVLAPDISLRFMADSQPSSPTAAQTSSISSPGWAGASLTPRSVFADDEVRYVPPGMTQDPPARLINGRTLPPRREDGGSVAGYPVPAGPLVGGGEGRDLYRRSGATGGPASTSSDPAGKLLYVCQTCGQLTAPDAVYCQSCRQPIAHECPVCRLNLLPIQDRCPRCHTSNPAYVGKAHPVRPGM